MRFLKVSSLREITEAQWAQLDASDAIVFGSPTYMGTASGAFHTFAEASAKRWATRAWQDKLAAGFTNSASTSGDKLHTLQFFTVLAAQHGMSRVSLNLLPGWNSSTAEHLGRRIAEQARIVVAGRAALAAWPAHHGPQASGPGTQNARAAP
ncbi:flavodoxin family protein [Streptomyces sp. Je 1-4]|uniref:flavodoxin family protein n=1 Tax=unclassified Streptomyces TaxID=2593676 RepID=UPI0021DB41F5|nr:MULTISPECIES: flavodoxin family protein [unclassified Streptomyces]UYB39719.1 flavodoxin family protein [Streptomyces sp. Je 1-4]UZQ35769.1 flavodoxin family protein [Streptomyces sp. Je 1-4] [Streptomyces sp. Je 1-4 4N24]UZQ43187.1 flavodoxin family protein [Streptomyces sp. Je 1-4] [Streptomyces sp. Je 1-4 4N24_ara]